LISSDVLRGYNDTMVLYLLHQEPSYGYELAKKIKETSGGVYTMKETTLYAVFQRLERNGLVTSFYGTETGGKRRTYYQITEEGKAYYKEKCEEWSLTKDVIERFMKGGE
jgi:PadR family transcriptional regulator PadR